MKQEKRHPEFKADIAEVKARVWTNQTGNGDGFLTVALYRPYTDKEGKEQQSHSFSLERIEYAIAALELVKAWRDQQKRSA